MVNSVSQTTETGSPGYFPTWAANLSVVVGSLKRHPILAALMVVSALVDAFLEMQGKNSPLRPAIMLCTLVNAISMYFILFTVMNAAYTKRQTGVAEYVHDDSSMQWRIVGVAWLYNFMWITASIFLLIPGFIVFVLFALAIPAVAVDKMTTQQALGESLKVTKIAFFKTAWFCSVAPIIINFGYFVGCLILGLIVGFVCPPLVGPVTALCGLCGWFAALSYAPPMVYLYAWLKENVPA